MTKQHILDEIKRTANENRGAALGRERFFKETGIRMSDWYGKYWVRWGDALREAGLDANQKNAAITDEVLIGSLITVARSLGRFPLEAELRMESRTRPGFPSHSTFRRLGRKNELVAKVRAYCSMRTEYGDVLEMCGKIPASTDEISDVPKDGSPEYGFVYLMKSGKYYKLGRSNSVGRREYDFGIQLPEQIKTIHKIKSDDPPGIEAYWHNRFAQKRKGGEWFDLTAADINAFRLRKFM